MNHYFNRLKLVCFISLLLACALAQGLTIDLDFSETPAGQLLSWNDQGEGDYRLETSSDLAQWSEVQTFTRPTGGTGEWLIANTGNNPMFYRLLFTEAGPLSPYRLKFEAEESINVAWGINESGDAFGGAYVTALLKNTSAADEAGVLSFPFTVDEGADEVSIWLRSLTTSGGDDSIFIRLVGAQSSWESLTGGWTSDGQWHWRNWDTFDLAAGDYRLEIAYRENGFSLDQVYVSSDKSAPDEGGGSYGGGTSEGSITDDPTVPAGVLNLTNWKLNLPINNANDITQPALSTFKNDDYFNVNVTAGNGPGIVFTAHAGGDTTGNSDYPRSELREMINFGATEANWSSAIGKHTMEFRAAVTALPFVKPHVVVGQIHTVSGNPLDDIAVFRFEGQATAKDGGNISVYLTQSSGKIQPPIMTGYVLGTPFTAKFVVENRKITAYFTIDGGETIEIEHPQEEIYNAYFKLGMYTQSNLTKGDAADSFGQCEVYSFNVTHE